MAEQIAVEEIYRQHTQLEHILEKPDTYIGSIRSDTRHMWVCSDDKIINKEIEYIPGLYKIFDEIIVNAYDHIIRTRELDRFTHRCNTIWVEFDRASGIFSVKNDGDGIPIVLHSETNVYVPHMIFGMLLTSSNYNNDEERLWGGTNGYGAKLANAYSTDFWIETVDHASKKKYVQRFYDNMNSYDEPEITKCKKAVYSKPYTKISFRTDLNRFGIQEFSEDFYNLIKKRVYDIAGCTAGIRVYFNDEELTVSSFLHYMKLYQFKSSELEIIYADINTRWSVGVMYNPFQDGFQQVSIVNGINTFNGGTHVKYILKQIIDQLTETIISKNKNVKIKNGYIKDNLTLFVNCQIVNPNFDSQTKESLNTLVQRFGSQCSIPTPVITKLAKSGIVDEVLNFSKLKEMAELGKEVKKRAKIKNNAKLEKALWAGTRKSHHCRLILTEGDSAKAFVMHGREDGIMGFDKYGIFPLKGKLLNVRSATAKTISKNTEILDILNIIGLDIKKSYDNDNDYKSLNYGGIIVIADSDHDGTHIKALVINLIHYFWPELINNYNFVSSIVTPIIKIWKNRNGKRHNETCFYNITDYSHWRENNSTAGWEVKYYKGLGTSNVREAKEALSNFESKIIEYISEETKTDDSETYNDYSETDRTMELAFSKSKADARKLWLASYNTGLKNDSDQRITSIPDFVNNELIHYSWINNIRSIPKVTDGFKPSQRKIVYGMSFNRSNSEKRVSQLAGAISEKALYHHGEKSLQEAIVKMAQNYWCSNNINLLVPEGQFGTRNLGDDAAQARYIHSKFEDILKNILRNEDLPVLEHEIEDEEVAEPRSYAPIIPFILVNGSVGIGTGYSTNIPKYNPEDIIDNCIRLLNHEEYREMTPWYYGYKGQLEKVSDTKYISYGAVEVLNSNEVLITELPVETWTEDYKIKVLDSMVVDDVVSNKKYIETYESMSNANVVSIRVKFAPGILKEIIKQDKLIESLKLKSNINLTNMCLFDNDYNIKRYTSIEDILIDFMDFRRDIYEKRMAYHLRHLENYMNIALYKIKYIEYKISGELDLRGKKKSVVEQELEGLEFPRLNRDVTEETKLNYEYLLSMRQDVETEEEIEKLRNKYEEAKSEFEEYSSLTIEQLWIRELEELRVEYRKMMDKRIQEENSETKPKKKTRRKRK